MNIYRLLRPLLFALDPERAHSTTLLGLEIARITGLSRLLGPRPKALPSRLLGLEFPNPVGLAAGLDKNGAHIDALGALGFGFLEIGTVTPRPQPGNPKPRLFRLPEHQALINRMGFNNDGLDVLLHNIERSHYRGVLGVNIGKNKDTPNQRAVEDYRLGLQRTYPLASFITVNISSPNTKGLRDLQHATALRHLLENLCDTREKLATQHGQRKPLLLKIAPDLDASSMDRMAKVLQESNFDGLICTNTTVSREGLAGHTLTKEAGGLSGAPLRAVADTVLEGMHQRLGDRIPLIGVGGILSGADAATKIQGGAQLVQCYTGLIYRGPQLISECVEAIRSTQGTSHAQ